MVILLRHENLYDKAPRVEFLNMEWARTKKISDLRTKFDHGFSLFVETNDKAARFDSFKWYQAIMNEANLLKVHVNTESIEGLPDVTTVTIHKEKSLADLKRVLS